jgi:hypothetical protein
VSTITCKDYRRALSDRLDEPLAKTEKDAFDAHGATCPACLTHMQDAVVLRETLKGVGALEDKEDAAAPKLPESLVQRILAAAKREREDVKKDVRKKG